MQKIINVFAVASFAVSSAIAVSGVYVYVNRDSIIDGVKQKVMGGIGGSALGGATGALGGGALTGDVGFPQATQPEPNAPAPQDAPPSAPSEFANF